MSIYEFDSNGIHGLYDPREGVKKILFPKGTIYIKTARHLLSTRVILLSIFL